jgi:hypothetical protein
LDNCELNNAHPFLWYYEGQVHGTGDNVWLIADYIEQEDDPARKKGSFFHERWRNVVLESKLAAFDW